MTSAEAFQTKGVANPPKQDGLRNQDLPGSNEHRRMEASCFTVYSFSVKSIISNLQIGEYPTSFPHAICLKNI